MSGMPAGHDACDKKKGNCENFPPGRSFLWNGGGSFAGSPVDRRKQAITAAREGFDKTWVFGGITEGVAQALDRSVQTVIEVYKGVGWPKTAVQFLSRNDFTRTLKEHGQNLEWLLLKANLGAVPAKFAGTKVGLKNSEVDDTFCLTLTHCNDLPGPASIYKTFQVMRKFRENPCRLFFYLFDAWTLISSPGNRQLAIPPALRYLQG